MFFLLFPTLHMCRKHQENVPEINNNKIQMSSDRLHKFLSKLAMNNTILLVLSSPVIAGVEDGMP